MNLYSQQSISQTSISQQKNNLLFYRTNKNLKLEYVVVILYNYEDATTKIVS